MRRVAILALVSLALWAEDPPATTFLVLKTGEPGAEPERAGPFLKSWAAYVSARAGAPQEGVITSDPARAVELAKERRPAWGVVTPSFFLERGKELALRPLLETRRGGHATERFTVVVRKGATWGDAEVATQLSAEAAYLGRVVFAGKEVRPRAAENLADAVYAMIEGDHDAPPAVLLDRASRAFFEEDELTWPKLDVVWESEELPPDLVVGFGEALTPEAEGKLREALVGMPSDEEGKRICRNLQTEGFGEVDLARWERARKALAGDPR